MAPASLPIYLCVAALAIYCCGHLCLAIIPPGRGKKPHLAVVDLDTEAGAIRTQVSAEDVEKFELEKRAFFSKTWLFVCHSSRFVKPGDYHAFDIAGIFFFIVLGKDSKLRAFHNVCRHRAYTVVRRDQGNSTRFSCKYHGWQYDEKGALVKAPKFESMQGFIPQDNGLFEIKLVATNDLIFVNFDPNSPEWTWAGSQAPDCVDNLQWKDSVTIRTELDWKTIAGTFMAPTIWTGSLRKQRIRYPLGPLNGLRHLERDLWCTESIVPIKAGQTEIRCDMLVRTGTLLSSQVIQKWKAILEKEAASFAHSEEQTRPFSYECDGRVISLDTMLNEQLRIESFRGTKSSPVFRFTGTENADFEAEALASKLECKMKESEGATMSNCSAKVEW